MKAPATRIYVSLVILAALALPAAAARRNADPTRNNPRVNPGHRRTDAEKDARQMDRDLKREDAEKKRAAERLKRFDTNRDGVLDDTEKAAMEAAIKERQEPKEQKEPPKKS